MLATDTALTEWRKLHSTHSLFVFVFSLLSDIILHGFYITFQSIDLHLLILNYWSVFLHHMGQIVHFNWDNCRSCNRTFAHFLPQFLLFFIEHGNGGIILRDFLGRLRTRWGGPPFEGRWGWRRIILLMDSTTLLLFQFLPSGLLLILPDPQDRWFRCFLITLIVFDRAFCRRLLSIQI